MSQVNVLRAAHYPRMPWKNGGGSTEEITRDTGTGLDGFGWRVSIADIAESGGFSSFAGYQRIITVLQGDGMILKVDGHDSRPLKPFDAFDFAGEAAVSSELLGGAIRDFNLIYSPARYKARLQWLEGEQRLFSSADTVLVFSASESLQVNVAGASQMLGRYDSLQIEEGGGALAEIALAGGRFCLIELIRIA
ncbi:HutD/Ves family protein [Pseudomonas abieticivorans]|uniref:HutD/Ves family protein n=1 Tax=Pseudomonas abieticivorans TaxID=2931382 RepID=UPI0020BFE12A|nr:HutD family protein [Pseudomonas sp. PIA16]